jgi:hypothetical protein
LLRIKGDLARLEEAAEAIRIAEDHYLQALEWARRQEALSWEPRAAGKVERGERKRTVDEVSKAD